MSGAEAGRLMRGKGRSEHAVPTRVDTQPGHRDSVGARVGCAADAASGQLSARRVDGRRVTAQGQEIDAPDRPGPVLVIGATGQQGGAAARALLERGWAVHAMVRDASRPAARLLSEAGASLVTGDLDDLASVRAAMGPARRVFLALTMMTGPRVTPEGVAAEERRGVAAATLAAEAGIAHLVYSSIDGAGQHTGIPYVESKTRIEERIHALRLPATILRPASFMDNFANLNRPALDGGELMVSLALRPQTRLPLVATRDIGVLTAIAFEHPRRYLGQQVPLIGDCLTGPQIAEVFARVCGLPARFRQVPIEQLRAFDPQVAMMFEWMDSRPGDEPDPALRAEYPGLLTLRDWLQATDWQPGSPVSAPSGQLS